MRFNSGHHEVIRALLAPYPESHEGRMFGYPAFYASGRMFACVYGNGLGLKLPAEEVSALLKRPDFVPFRPHNRPPMREWVQLNRERSEEFAADLPILLKAMRFVTRKDVRRAK